MNQIMAKIWPYLAIIIMGVAIYLLLKQLSSMQDNVDRLSNNMEQMLDEHSSKTLEMTKKEFKNYIGDTLLHQLMDSLNLKVRHIERVYTHHYNHTYDTTIYLVVDTLKPLRKAFGVQFNPCIGVYGHVDSSTITFDSIPVRYNATTVYYWKRPHKFWFVKYGKKQYFSDTKNNCTGESRVELIDIVK